jgi:hypothetical protein
MSRANVRDLAKRVPLKLAECLHIGDAHHDSAK